MFAQDQQKISRPKRKLTEAAATFQITESQWEVVCRKKNTHTDHSMLLPNYDSAENRCAMKSLDRELNGTDRHLHEFSNIDDMTTHLNICWTEIICSLK